MKKLLSIACMLPALTLTENAVASPSVYVGAGFHAGLYEEDIDVINASTDFEARPAAISFRVGAELTKNLGFQIRYVQGTESGEEDIFLFGEDLIGEIDVNSISSFFLKGTLPVNKSIGFYGLVGVSELDATATIGADGIDDLAKVTEKDSSASLGVGLQASINDSIGLYGEYVSYYNSDETNYSALELGALYKF